MGKTSPMHSNPEVLEVERLALNRAEHVNAVDFGKLLRDLALSVVVALDDENKDASATQPQHLVSKEQTGAEVGPVAVVDDASQDDESNAVLDRECDEGD